MNQAQIQMLYSHSWVIHLTVLLFIDEFNQSWFLNNNILQKYFCSIFETSLLSVIYVTSQS